jgi:phytol kinase
MDIQDRIQFGRFESGVVGPIARWIPGELVRKSLHLLIALVPPLASVNLAFTISLIAVGTLFYAFAEASRNLGRQIFIISDITLIASRERDKGRFVLGPVTLGLGALLALMLYPMPAATIAIYALAFGDGLASLAGKMIVSSALPGFKGKTISGSLACFLAVFLVTLIATSQPPQALGIAVIATIIEAMPLGNYDNLAIPMAVGLAATRMFPL